MRHVRLWFRVERRRFRNATIIGVLRVLVARHISRGETIVSDLSEKAAKRLASSPDRPARAICACCCTSVVSNQGDDSKRRKGAPTAGGGRGRADSKAVFLGVSIQIEFIMIFNKEKVVQDSRRLAFGRAHTLISPLCSSVYLGRTGGRPNPLLRVASVPFRAPQWEI